MKTTLAIVCSLVLVWTQFVRAQPGAGVARATRACCSCHASCCAAPSTPEPSPLSAAPAPNFQTQLIFLAFVAHAWNLPAGDANELSSAASPSPSSVLVPLYTLNCARLI